AVAVGAALIWLNLSQLSSALGLALIGFAAGPVFPSLIAATPRRVGDAHTANAVGFLISAAVLCASLLPAAVGIVADRLGLEIVGPSLLALALALIALYESLRFAGPKEMREATLPA